MRWFINWITLKGKLCSIANLDSFATHSTVKIKVQSTSMLQMNEHSWWHKVESSGKTSSLPCPSKQLWTTAVNLMAWHSSVYTGVSALPICVLMLHVLKCPGGWKVVLLKQTVLIYLSDVRRAPSPAASWWNQCTRVKRYRKLHRWSHICRQSRCPSFRHHIPRQTAINQTRCEHFLRSRRKSSFD